MSAMRDTYITRVAQGGCFVCHGSLAKWAGPNAQGVAARHHDATGHRTWCDVTMCVTYGSAPADDRQTDIEDAIGGAA
ncbi:hypothetical protein [Sphingomonas sp. 8AM]|uniref:hypothetical protein n=1 Tax=Sphingomonas sp. 8AM TaxID=2653170 RepID=UPI0012F464B1|nr:hypothetical protein [Sphingomonas sp. 8AM]VXC80208.1 conserved hypothetical protein [Sphingomonas sp. 8AM]